MWGLDNLHGARSSKHDPTLQLFWPPLAPLKPGTARRGTDSSPFLSPGHSQPHAVTGPFAHRRSSTWEQESLHRTSLNRPLNPLTIASSGRPRRDEADRDRYLGSYPQSETHSTAPKHTQLQPPPRNPKRLVQRDLNWRPTSSVYEESIKLGRASPAAPLSDQGTKLQGMGGLEDSLEISPPSSPEIDTNDGPAFGDVSPIDEVPPLFPQRTVTASQARGSGLSDREMLPSQRGQSRASESNAQPTTMLRSKQIRPPQQTPGTLPAPRRDARPRAESGQHHPPARDMAPLREAPRPNHRASRNVWDPPVRPSPGRAWSPQGVTHQRTASPSIPIPTSQARRRSGAASPFGQRLDSLGKNRPEPIDTRPPWNGAGARQTRMQPIRDNIHVPPLNILPRNRRSSANAGQGPANSRQSFISKTGHDAASTVKSFLPGRQKHNHAQSSSISAVGRASSLSPDLGPVTMRPGKPHVAPSPEPTGINTASSSPFQELPSPIPMKKAEKPMAIRRKPPPSTQPAATPSPPPNPLAIHPPGLEHIGRRTGGDTDPMSSPSPDPVEPDDNWVPPPSRFSITTYATSKADSRRGSFDEGEDVPPVPAITEAFTSVMNRSRPIRELEDSGESADEPVIVSMKSPYSPTRKKDIQNQKPKPNPLAFRDHRLSPIHVRTISATAQVSQSGSTEKALPPAPPEILSANDRVANLDARLRGLMLRRDNINKSITQMTELMPQDNLLASDAVLKRRELEKKKVEQLRKELALIQQEEYELGIKLHRANKRIDREAGFEPARLWVRRVTG